MSTKATLLYTAVILTLVLTFSLISAVSLTSVHQPDILMALSELVNLDISALWAQFNIEPGQMIAGNCTTTSGNTCGG